MPLGKKAAQMLRALDRLLVPGLSAMDPTTAEKLSGFLRANGFGAAAAEAAEMVDPAPEKRYRTFVELRRELEGAVVKLYRPPAPDVPADAWGLLVPEADRIPDPARLAAAARGFRQTDAALLFLAGSPDLSSLTDDGIEALLANADLRSPAVGHLRKLPPEGLAPLLDRLARQGNALVRRSVWKLAEGLDELEAARRLLPTLVHPGDLSAAFEFLFPRRKEVRQALEAVLTGARTDPTPGPDAPAPPVLPTPGPAPLPARRLAMRILARSAKEGEPDRWAPACGDDPELAGLLRVARYRAGEIDVIRMRSFATSIDEPVLRALAIAQLLLDGEIDTPRFQKEMFQRRDQLEPLLTPLKGTGRIEGLAKTWRNQLRPSNSPGERRGALDELAALDEPSLAWLLAGWRDEPSPELADRMLDLLVEWTGLEPLAMAVDLAPLEGGDFDRFGSDVLHAYQTQLLPRVKRLPDVRFAPFLAYLVRRHGPAALPAGTLEALAEPAIPALGSLLSHPDPATRRLALASLEGLRHDPRAARVLEEREQGEDPLELAVARLVLPGSESDGRARLESLGRDAVAPRLIELAKSRKDLRDPLLALLAEWRRDEALPLLAKLLGSPAPDLVKGKPGSRETRWLEKPVGRWLTAYRERGRAPLEAALANGNWTVRHHAAWLLGRDELASPASSPALARALAAETEDEVKAELIQTLGTSGGSEAVAALLPVARSGGPMVPKALRALSQTGEPQAKKELEAMLAEARDLNQKRDLRRALDGFGTGASS